MSKFIHPACGITIVVLFAWTAQADQVVLVAGGGDKDQDGVPATEARLHMPFGIDFDPSGTMYIVELEGGHVHRVDAGGKFSTIAGNGKKGDAGVKLPLHRLVVVRAVGAQAASCFAAELLAIGKSGATNSFDCRQAGITRSTRPLRKAGSRLNRSSSQRAS